MRIIGADPRPSKVAEAFRAGTAGIVYQKIIKILSRRMGLKFSYTDTPVPVFFKHPELGKLAGYFFMHPTGQKMYRLNFDLGASDKIASVDIFNDFMHIQPTYTVDLQGNNIVQVIDLICDVLSGAYFEYVNDIADPEAKREATHNDIVKDWLTATPSALRSVQSGNFDLDELYTEYARYSNDTAGKAPCAQGSFRWNLNAGLAKLGSRTQVPTVRVTSGARTVALTQPREEATFEDAISSNEHILTFEYLENTMERLKANDKRVKNVYIYGVGGIGKTKTVNEVLGGLPNFVSQKSPISGYTGLLQLLFNNKEGKILLLDDCVKPADLKNGQMENILKAAMDSDDPRRISIAKAQRGESSVRDRLKVKNEIIDLVNFDSNDGVGEEETMWNFLFTSKIIFVTNIPYIPEAIGDRCITIEMNFNKEQILDIIQKALEGFDPEVDIDDKIFVWNWLKEHRTLAKKISFRVFSNILGIYLAGKNAAGNKWEQFAKLMLKSGMAPNY